jgi:hypothetical protein
MYSTFFFSWVFDSLWAIELFFVDSNVSYKNIRKRRKSNMLWDRLNNTPSNQIKWKKKQAYYEKTKT